MLVYLEVIETQLAGYVKCYNEILLTNAVLEFFIPECSEMTWKL